MRINDQQIKFLTNPRLWLVAGRLLDTGVRTMWTSHVFQLSRRSLLAIFKLINKRVNGTGKVLCDASQKDGCMITVILWRILFCCSRVSQCGVDCRLHLIEHWIEIQPCIFQIQQLSEIYVIIKIFFNYWLLFLNRPVVQFFKVCHQYYGLSIYWKGLMKF